MFRAWPPLGEILPFFKETVSKMGTLSLANDFKTKGKDEKSTFFIIFLLFVAKGAALSQTEGWVRVTTVHILKAILNDFIIFFFNRFSKHFCIEINQYGTAKSSCNGVGDDLCGAYEPL